MKTFITLSVLLAGIIQAQALVISEIMYDPQGTNTNRVWIEVFNDTDSAVNMTGWKFFESGVNHGITAYQGGASLPASGYAVIADSPIKFLADYPSYSGILLDSSFPTLPSGGEVLSLKASSSASPAYTVDYAPYVLLGGNNDGSTLSLVSGSWVRGRATPGAENVAEEKPASSATSTDGTGDNQITIPQATPPSPDIVFYMPKELLAVAGAETTLKASGLTRAGKEIEDLRFSWAFGDGGRGAGSSTKHTYVYSGRYIAQVQGSNNYVGGTGRMVVRVVPPDISIAGAGEGKYGTYVDVNNPNAYDLDVSGWAISIEGAVYPFPENTIIGADSTTRFAGSAMGFASTTVHEGTVFKIQFPNLEEVARFIPASAGQVAGTSTSVATSASSMLVSKTALYKPLVKKAAAVNEKTTAPTSSRPVIRKNQQDKRIVSWFKSIFGL